MNKYIVYKHTSPSGKVYVGITKRRAKDRWKYGHGYKHNKYFYNAIMKYGWDNIEHLIVASDLSLEEACSIEKELISLYTLQGKCYNIAEGGVDGNTYSRTEELKQHLSNFFKDYFKTHDSPFKGRHHTEEFKERQCLKGREHWKNNYTYMYDRIVFKIKIGTFNVITSTYKEFSTEKEAAEALKIPQTTLRRHVYEGNILNKTYIIIPLETLTFEEALLKAYKRELLNVHCGGLEVAVVLLSLEGEYINRYPSAKQASFESGVNASSIGKTCRGELKLAGGYRWIFNREYLRQH